MLRYYRILLSKICLKKIRLQGRNHLFTKMKPMLHRDKVVEFYANLKILDGLVVSSTVKGVDMMFDVVKLCYILHIPSEGLEKYVWRTDEDCLFPKLRWILKTEMIAQ